MKTLVASGLIAVLSFFAMIFYLRDLEPNVVRAQLTFSSDGFERVARQWSPAALERFRRHFIVDYVCIACYSMFGAQFGLRLVRRRQGAETRGGRTDESLAGTDDLHSMASLADRTSSGGSLNLAERADSTNRGGASDWLSFLPWLLPAAGVCDTIENTLELVFLAARPRPFFEPAYLLAGSAAAMKFMLFGLFSVGVLLAIKRAKRRERSKLVAQT